MEEQTGTGGQAPEKPVMNLDEGLDASSTEASASMPPETVSIPQGGASELLADTFEQGRQLLNEHKGKLAIGVAATLGLMVFYKWREKRLAEDDPEEYARLQRIKAGVRHGNASSDDAPRATEVRPPDSK
jgi:hypothetical protein